MAEAEGGERKRKRHKQRRGRMGRKRPMGRRERQEVER